MKAPLREFVYLDDVSVYSLIASRLGPVATEFTDSEANSLRSEVSANVGANAGFAKSNLTAASEATTTQQSQVVRKSIVQTTFKELVELEANGLLLRPMDAETAPKLKSVESLRSDGAQPAEFEGWVVDPNTLLRGCPIEVEVTLEAEAIFRVNAVASAFLEMIQENYELFGIAGPSELSELHSVNRVLERLLSGLVPIRGRAVDYVVVSVHDREWLVHRELVDSLPSDARVEHHPLFVVGVADRGLFWKDIRRVLFSGYRFRVFARVAHSGLRDSWTPVKLADVLGEISPELADQLGGLGEGALAAMGNAAARSSEADVQGHAQGRHALECFADLVNEHHGGLLSAEQLDGIVWPIAIRAEAVGLGALGDRRQLFGEVAKRIDEAAGTETPREAAADLRVAAIMEAGLGYGGSLAPPANAQSTAGGPTAEQGRFLDTEIVAVYW